MEKIFVSAGLEDMTLTEILAMVESFQAQNPDMDVFLDGDRKVIAGRPRAGFTER